MQEKKLSNRICPEGMSIEEWQVALREEAARNSSFQIKHLDNNRIWGDYLVSHFDSESSYRIAFRGVQSERNYCSCLDFRTSGLGTCKHIEAVILSLKDEIPGYPWGDMVYTPLHSSIFVSYKGGRTIQFSAGINETELFSQFRSKYFGEDNVLPECNYEIIDDICAEALSLSPEFRCYEDVYEFIDSELSTIRWRQKIKESYPDKKVTTDFAQSSQSDPILTELYDMLINGHGIIVSDMTNALRKEILSMIEVVLQYEDGPAMIIANNIHTMDIWKTLINRSPLAGSIRLFLISQEQFRVTTRMPSGLFSFLFVEEGECLKDWNNIISKTIKKLNVKHLYMHIPSLSHLTPVQFSSISQHISPFILAPFHRFIRDFRPAFPLSDLGENLPPQAKSFVFTRNETRSQLWNDEILSGEYGLKKEQVDNFLKTAIDILNDSEKVEILNIRLKGLLGL